MERTAYRSLIVILDGLNQACIIITPARYIDALRDRPHALKVIRRGRKRSTSRHLKLGNVRPCRFEKLWRIYRTLW
jgi:hypothetical protein